MNFTFRSDSSAESQVQRPAYLRRWQTISVAFFLAISGHCLVSEWPMLTIRAAPTVSFIVFEYSPGTCHWYFIIGLNSEIGLIY